MNEIDDAEVAALTGEPYFNLSYGGASLKEIIDTFWFAQRHVQLKKVYIGLNLNLYNDYNYTERTKTYLTIEKSPAIYFVNRTVLEAAWDDAYSRIRGVDLKLGVPKMSREEFWQYSLGPLTAAYYSRYVYPQRYRGDLHAIAEFCRSHDIRLTFVIFPTHVELQSRIADFHLSEAAARFRADLASMAVTYDFDYPTEITLSKQNFRDPYHFTEPIGVRMIRQIWGHESLSDGVLLEPPAARRAN